MNAETIKPPRNWLRLALFSPTAFVWCAVGLAGLFGLCHLAGLREHTTLLSGPATSAGLGRHVSVVLGVAHIAAYLGFVLLAPILLLAAALLRLGQSLLERRSNERG